MSVAWVCRSRRRAPGLGQVGGLVLFGLAGGGCRLGQPGALGGQVALHLDALAGAVLAGMLVHEALLGQPLHVGLALAGQGQRGVELGNGLAHGGGLGLAARVLGVEFGQPCLDVLPFRLEVGVVGRAALTPALSQRERG